MALDCTVPQTNRKDKKACAKFAKEQAKLAQAAGDKADADETTATAGLLGSIANKNGGGAAGAKAPGGSSSSNTTPIIIGVGLLFLVIIAVAMKMKHGAVATAAPVK